jgi:hypothetical protein
MTEYQQKVSSSWNQQMRRIRFRRRRENLRLWNEFKIVPRWLKATLATIFVLAQGIALAVNLHLATTGETAIPELRENPPLAMLAVAGIIAGVWLLLSIYTCLIAYVNRDAKRRGMSSGLWSFLVIVLSPAYFAVGFIVYFLMREPLPYSCPQCGTTVGARFNYCPNCKCNLHPSCPQCKREVAEGDKFCPYCAQELAPAAIPGGTAGAGTESVSGTTPGESAAIDRSS